MLGLECFAFVVGLTFIYGQWRDKAGSRIVAPWLAFGPPLIGLFSVLIIWLAYGGRWPIAMGFWETVIWTAVLAMAAIVSLIISLLNNEVCQIMAGANKK